MLLVVAWDGACFELADRFRGEGRMPVLDALLARGRAWAVSSTIPPVTFPAWTSFLTGASPDRHGIVDFTLPRPGAYGVRFANASHRRLPTVFAAMAAAGRRVGVYGLPATYPPEGRATFEVCGFDTPLGSAAARDVTHPPALAAQLRERYGRLGVEGLPQGRIDEGWHAMARSRLVDDIERRTRIAADMARERSLDVLAVHYMESDTVSHHFWQFDDAGSPRHRAGAGCDKAIGEVYAALDRGLACLLEAAGSDTRVLLLSDHGSAGASDRAIFWNRFLADRGWLRFDGRARAGMAPWLRRAALAVVPPSMQARLFAAARGAADQLESRARYAGIDWKGTLAFSDEVPYFPSIRLNIAGREASGALAPHDVDSFVGDLTRALLEWRDPFDDLPVVEAVRRREDLFDGPCTDLYPDLVLQLRRPGGYAYAAGSSRGGREAAALRRLEEAERTGARGSSTSGCHSDEGMAVIAGPGVGAAPERGRCTLMDLGVTALAAAGLEPSPSMNGRALLFAQAVGDDARPANVASAAVSRPHGAATTDGGPLDYDADEEREVAERLRALGYLP